MNERIRDLYEQAYQQSRSSPGLFELKFAELIVEEMYDFIMEESASDNGIPDLGKVKQHFGVER